MPDGIAAVDLATTNKRETMLTRGILAFRSAWTKCRSVVVYVEDRDRSLVE
jgi:hypothetical protein